MIPKTESYYNSMITFFYQNYSKN